MKPWLADEDRINRMDRIKTKPALA